MKCKSSPMNNIIKITRPDDSYESILDTKIQKRYQSGVGSLLYIVKFSRPDFSNRFRDLSKFMDREK